MIKVLDFYVLSDLKINFCKKLLMSSATFCILAKKKDEIKEFSVTVPKKTKFNKLLSNGEFDIDKVNEYSALVDFIKFNGILVKEKWNINEKELQELIVELNIIMLKKYSCVAPVVRLFKLAKEYLRLGLTLLLVRSY